MSFAVFGASMDFCVKIAKKRVKMTKGSGKNLVRLTQDEWGAAVNTYAAKLYEDYSKGIKAPAKISADMTTPSAAKEFITLAMRTSTCSALRIFQRQPLEGRFHPKTKQQIMKFQPWAGS
ncbi:hypothetical protein CXF83_15140 [Shewanella sp. Choline-02u-19]|uniref:hypothetical protein n=1 Tax=unclassified Shewanella TaxID=196818 RepID=UPI000C325E9A|nr:MULTISPECIES: hypothetical protein [unclassified Shewanella]PKH56542.1 hypothetical protein CXF84_13205 [Shewanella sp. Bg11-22]PKI27952.1 hypothetical protein CXF83_15140 [Shewanella sp. Choline-02u-19]